MYIHCDYEFIWNGNDERNTDENPIEWSEGVVNNFVMIFHFEIPFLNFHIEVVDRYID